MQPNQFILYGANGYTARIIAALAENFDLHPILAGRNREAMQELSKELRMPYRVIDLEDPAGLNEGLSGVKLVLHAAGPFQLTARPMIEACIANRIHYIDITGEVPVFEMARSYNGAAIEAGIMVMPGVGFDVVPTDCLALFLKKQLPDADHLELAFANSGGGLSHGTATTMVMSLGEGGLSRENGRIVKKPLGHKGKWIEVPLPDRGKRSLFVMTIPWGDISTGYFTTGIPNIDTYTAIPTTIYRLLKVQVIYNWLLRTSIVRKYINKRINGRPAGPAPEAREKSSALIWGKVQNPAGDFVEASMMVKDGYTLTGYSSLLIAQKILAGDYLPGYQTPAAVYGEDLVLQVPGTKRTPALKGRST